jgi:hypothetical protein
MLDDWIARLTFALLQRQGNRQVQRFRIHGDRRSFLPGHFQSTTCDHLPAGGMGVCFAARFRRKITAE